VTFNETGKKYAQHPCEDFHDLAYCKKIEKICAKVRTTIFLLHER